MEVERVVAEARRARRRRRDPVLPWARHGAGTKDRDMEAVVAMVEGVKALGMETCMTLGMLERGRRRHG